MDCEEHRNDKLANCPSCLAEYWKCKYNEAIKDNDDLTALLRAHTSIASKGIYYSLDEIKEHDIVIALQALNVMKRTAAQRRFNVDPVDHQEFFEAMYYEIHREFKHT